MPPGMTIPRRVVPGTTYALTRRCLDRRFYLKPGPRWRLDKTATFPLGTWWVVQRAGAALA